MSTLSSSYSSLWNSRRPFKAPQEATKAYNALTQSRKYNEVGSVGPYCIPPAALVGMPARTSFIFQSLLFCSLSFNRVLIHVILFIANKTGGFISINKSRDHL